MRLELSALVESDLEAIADWIAEDNPRRALTFIREIREEFGRIAKGPELYRLRPEIGDDARLAVVGRYVIMFRFDADVVRIERVVYGGRNPPSLLQSL